MRGVPIVVFIDVAIVAVVVVATPLESDKKTWIGVRVLTF